MLPSLTLDDVRLLAFQDLIERTEAILAAYDKPEVETHRDKLARIERTLEEIPAIYRWLLQCQSWLDHWTDTARDMGGMDRNYKKWRQRRDFFERMGSAAKQRYEAASRVITLEMGFAPDAMPQSRSRPGA